MTLTIAEWHQRYIQQAGWSADLRRLIYSFPWFSEAQYILELGCGTGAVLQEILSFHKHCVIGLDIENEPLVYASAVEQHPKLVQADGYSTPFPDSAFDVSFCHYLLLWTKYPGRIMTEMMRVTKPGGWILAFAEPDYGGRIDFPTELEALGKMQIQSLIQQGANPYTGRTLRSMFSNPNISNVVCGIFGAQWTSTKASETKTEINILQSDYGRLGKSHEFLPQDQFIALQQCDRQAWENQTRVLFVPTFYTWGQVEKP